MTIAILLVGLLPGCRAKNLLLGLLTRGSSIHHTARVQPVVLWRIGRMRLGARSYVGPGNAFRDMERIELDDDAEIGQFNWFSAAGRHIAPAADGAAPASLVMGAHSAITSRHYVDCSGGVHLDRAAVIAGVRSTVLSHSLDPYTWRQETRPVRIGRSSVVFTNVVLTAGSTVADDCLVGAGAVVTGDLSVPGRFYAGTPAREISDVSGAAFTGRESSRSAPRPGGRPRPVDCPRNAVR